MKILMINGTMRKESTYNAAKTFLDEFMTDEDMIAEAFLPRELSEFCRGCGLCIKEGEEKCPDYLIYMRRLTKLIDEADLLVFTTPTLVLHASGQMTSFLDHYAYRFMVHRPEPSMFKKQAVIFSTSAGYGHNRAIKDIKDSLRQWGVARIYTCGVAVQSTSWDEVKPEIVAKIEEKTAKLVTKIQRDPNLVSASLTSKLLFYFVRMMHKKGNLMVKDTVYWEDMGWLGTERPWNHVQHQIAKPALNVRKKKSDDDNMKELAEQITELVKSEEEKMNSVTEEEISEVQETDSLEETPEEVKEDITSDIIDLD